MKDEKHNEFKSKLLQEQEEKRKELCLKDGRPYLPPKTVDVHKINVKKNTVKKDLKITRSSTNVVSMRDRIKDSSVRALRTAEEGEDITVEGRKSIVDIVHGRPASIQPLLTVAGAQRSALHAPKLPVRERKMSEEMPKYRKTLCMSQVVVPSHTKSQQVK